MSLPASFSCIRRAKYTVVVIAMSRSPESLYPFSKRMRQKRQGHWIGDRRLCV
ncbi:hypothetical protein [Phormidesmis sp. 146-33]